MTAKDAKGSQEVVKQPFDFFAGCVDLRESKLVEEYPEGVSFHSPGSAAPPQWSAQRTFRSPFDRVTPIKAFCEFPKDNAR